MGGYVEETFIANSIAEAQLREPKGLSVLEATISVQAEGQKQSEER